MTEPSTTPIFIEVGSSQVAKEGQDACGDVFLSRRLDEGRRVICVLADGLGSGVEANVLASLTATMALEYMSGDDRIEQAAEIMMDALPVCRRRKISYSTFSIVDINAAGCIRLIEHGNSPVLLMRAGRIVDVERRPIVKSRWNGRGLSFAKFATHPEDRLIMFSDGITQAGLGKLESPLGWDLPGVEAYLQERLQSNPMVSARDLAQWLTGSAIRKDGGRPGDDITCATIFMRRPRRMVLWTGPPFYPERDTEVAQYVAEFDGHKAICGGTTSDIMARERKLPISMDLQSFDPEVPTTSNMPGIDLVSEGCITLGKTVDMLEAGQRSNSRNGATMLMDLILKSDQIELVVGTAVNPAHQDPCLPVELDIRRNLIRRLRGVLEEQYLKETCVRFM
jgi:serine/threonine protein phosphatase PrpC